jgi:hypothetical protein
MADAQPPPVGHGHAAGGEAKPRAFGLVFGAREADEPVAGPALYTDFEKDWDAQLAVIRRWSDRHGHLKAGYEVWSVLSPANGLAAYLGGQRIPALVIAGARIRDRMRDTWGEWPRMMAELDAAGVRVEIAEEPGPS